LTGSGGTDSSSPFAVLTNGGATITWHATENGSFTVRLAGTNCTNGTQVASGSYSSSPNTVSTSIAAADLAVGSNTLRVCVTDVATPTPNTGASENVTGTQDTTAPTVTTDSTTPWTTNTRSATTTVTIQNNQAPTADSKTLSANEDTPLAITLTGSDPDGNALTFTVITPPAHGTLGSIGTVSCTGNPSNCSENITYTPFLNYNGADSFAYKTHEA